MRHVLEKLVIGVFFISGLALAEPPKATPELLEKGKAAFTTNCVACHGEKGDGSGPAAAALNPKPRNFATEPFKQGDSPQEVFNTISKGVPGTTMVGFAHLSEEERWAITHYVRKLAKPDGAPAKAKSAKTK